LSAEQTGKGRHVAKDKTELFTTILKQTVQLARAAQEASEDVTKGSKSTSLLDLTKYGLPSDEEKALKAFLLTQTVATGIYVRA